MMQLDIEQFTLAGHSLGGLLAGKYAHKYPNNVITTLYPEIFMLLIEFGVLGKCVSAHLSSGSARRSE